MPLGFSMVLPCILTPQSLGKYRKLLGICGYNWVLPECFAFKPKRVSLRHKQAGDSRESN